MFDFGFSKLLLLGIVALVVIGPERLPKVARTMGHLYGRLQRYVTQVKSDINREMEAADLGNMKTEFESAARSFQSEVETSVHATSSSRRARRKPRSSARSTCKRRPRTTPRPSPADARLALTEAGTPRSSSSPSRNPQQPATRDRAAG